MKQILRVALMVLLAAVLGVGCACGEKKEYTDGNGVTWEYEEIEAGATCSIGIPERNRGSISGFVKIPGTLEVDGVSIKVVSIGYSAFRGCSLTGVKIPSSVTEIGEGAFYGCSSLTAVTIPSSVTEIGVGAFADCSGLKSIGVESGNERYCSEQGVLFTKGRDTLVCYPGGKPEESYTIPSSVTEIGGSAFEGCIGLTAVTIPSSVTEIGDYAFYGCIGLTGVKIPSSVTEIGEGAFYGCSSLTAVTIPSSVTEIGVGAFADCSGLKSIGVESGNERYCSEQGVLFTKGRDSLVCYPGGKPEEHYAVPSGVTKIGSSAFAGCKGLKGVSISGSVTEIGGGAFEGCIGLKSIGVESGNERYCSEQGVLFTKGRDTLVCYPGGKPEEHYAVPSGVTKIGSSAFAGCKGLKGVSISGSVTEIGGGAFADCSGLTAVTIPSSVTVIGVAAFENCSGLTAVTISEGVTEIRWEAFKNCSSLMAVTIPSSVTEIGDEAFADCSGLKEVYWLAGANCSVFSKAFYRIASPATLYVRQGKTKDIEETWWAKEYFPVVVEGFVVTFTNSDRSRLFGEQLVMPNGTATVATAPTKEGYIVEWQFDGTKYDFGTPVTKNITLVAVWKKK